MPDYLISWVLTFFIFSKDDGDSEDLEKKELVDCIIKWTKNSTRDQIHSLQKQHNQKQKHSSA